MAENTTQKEFSFFNELTNRVDQYFEQSGRNKWGDWRIHTKSVILISALIGIYITLVFYTPAAWYISLTLCHA
jgi:linoleoyl-CoA desaturase